MANLLVLKTVEIVESHSICPVAHMHSGDKKDQFGPNNKQNCPGRRLSCIVNGKCNLNVSVIT